jgi:hypothetical protein
MRPQPGVHSLLRSSSFIEVIPLSVSDVAIGNKTLMNARSWKRAAHVLGSRKTPQMRRLREELVSRDSRDRAAAPSARTDLGPTEIPSHREKPPSICVICACSLNSRVPACYTCSGSIRLCKTWRDPSRVVCRSGGRQRKRARLCLPVCLVTCEGERGCNSKQRATQIRWEEKTSKASVKTSKDWSFC